MRPTLVTGVTGLLGPYLIETMTSRGKVVGTGGRGGEIPCDLTDARATRRMVESVDPGIVIHSAALSLVDECEGNPARAAALNRDATRNLVSALAPDTKLVAISTDQVYADTDGPHPEDNTGPVNTYGLSKLDSEREAMAHPGALIVRTNFFGPSRTPGRQSLSDWIAANLAERHPITLFLDSLYSPLQMDTVAALIAEALDRNLSGIFNFGSRAGMSKRDFGFAVARRLGLATDSAASGYARDIPGRARRARDLRMDVSRLESALGRRLPTLREEIDRL